MPGELNLQDEDFKKYVAYLQAQYSGLGKAHNLMVLPNGEELKPISLPDKDAQFLENRQFQNIEFCEGILVA